MTYKHIGFLLFALVLLLPKIGYSQNESHNLDPKHINNCVYEVIVAKPSEDKVTYEKPLPLDFLPFKIRNDKYYSIGTAFAISKTEFITAAHVTFLGIESQFQEIFLRDTQGNIFSVDSIIKFSSRRDFAVFTVKDRLSTDHLDINPESNINDKVYAVGNALGQGIIIRDGLYTSNTPEEVDGKWNWIRFSAAASPGNSGGPLLDINGKVIGLVLGKSPSENLNNALPISEIQKDYSNFAEIYEKDPYFLDFFDSVKTETLDTKIKLPMTYKDFNKSLKKTRNEFIGGLLRDLISENKENIFPNGDGSKKLFYKNSISNFPQLITRSEDGNWDLIQPQKTAYSDLGNNGYISHGSVKSVYFLKIQKPDNISLDNFYSDSKLYFDLILKSLRIPRVIGPEKIRITSLGKADSEFVHVDSFGRNWLVKTWSMPFNDLKIVSFALPMPGGSLTMMKIGQTGQILDQDIPDLKVYTDFVYVSFDGTLMQWQEYLGMKKIVPSLFKKIELVVKDDYFEFNSKRLKISLKPDVMKLTEQSILTLGLGYFWDSNSLVWDITAINIREDKFKDNSINLTRNIKAPQNVDDKYLDHWNNLLEESKPYNAKTYLIKDNTAISTVYKQFSTPKSSDKYSVLYDILNIRIGMVDQNEMDSNMKKIIRNISIYEN